VEKEMGREEKRGEETGHGCMEARSRIVEERGQEQGREGVAEQRSELIVTKCNVTFGAYLVSQVLGGYSSSSESSPSMGVNLS
jgi:hypothetical protein